MAGMGMEGIDLEQLLAMFAANPSLMEGLATMSVFDPKSNILGQRAGRAQQLQFTPSAQGQHAGGTYVASSPLEHMGVAMQRIQGGQQMRDVSGQQDAMLSGDVNTRKGLAQAMAEVMRRARGGAQGPMNQFQDPGDGFGGTDI